MNDFLNKQISDLSDKEFNGKYAHLCENDRINILHELTKIRLQKNNEFAIKEVFDEETFEENSKVLKEVVELLQNYRFRYAKKQPFLGDFFELLLTTGLKQESGQFFTPVPIARFICKSIPMRAMMEKKLRAGVREELLPNIIDYAAGSGHFLTEAMEELQNTILSLNIESFAPSVQKELKTWKEDAFAWAYHYIYGIELDYRLVKTTKVGCYLHGDGVANVIHGDGLDNFTTGNYL
jgi:type I restriction enzyme M protein